MRLIRWALKRLVPVVLIILHPSFALSDLPLDDPILSDVEIVQVVPGPKGLIAGKPAALKLTIKSTFSAWKYIAIRVSYNSGSTYLDEGKSGLGIPIVPGENVVYIPGGPASPASFEPWIGAGNEPYLVWGQDAEFDYVNVMIDAEEQVLEKDERNNIRAFYVDVLNTPSLRVLIAPVVLGLEEGWELDASLIEKQRKLLEDTYPVPNVVFDYRAL
jgi:hypothetical protein